MISHISHEPTPIILLLSNAMHDVITAQNHQSQRYSSPVTVNTLVLLRLVVCEYVLHILHLHNIIETMFIPGIRSGAERSVFPGAGTEPMI